MMTCCKKTSAVAEVFSFVMISFRHISTLCFCYSYCIQISQPFGLFVNAVFQPCKRSFSHAAVEDGEHPDDWIIALERCLNGLVSIRPQCLRKFIVRIFITILHGNTVQRLTRQPYTLFFQTRHCIQFAKSFDRLSIQRQHKTSTHPTKARIHFIMIADPPFQFRTEHFLFKVFLHAFP